MAFIPVPQTAQVRIVSSYFNDTVINNLYFEKQGTPPTITEMRAMQASVNDWFGNTMLTFLPSTFTFQRTEARLLTTQFDLVSNVSTNAGVGDLSGAGLPGNVTASIKFDGGIAGRAYHGGNHFSGLIEANVTGNTIDSTWLASVVAGYMDLLTLFPAGGEWIWVIVSRYFNNLPRTEGITSPVQGAYTVNARVHTQRSRVNGR